MALKIIYYFIGLIFLSLGITFTLISDLGAGGWDALVENLYKITDIKIGTWVIIVALSLLIISAILERKFIDYKAFLVSIIMGNLIDFFYYPLTKILILNSFREKLILLVIGLILVGLGCAMMFVTNLPKNHTETFVFSVVNKTGLSYQKIKTLVDTSALLIAIIIGIQIQDFSNLGLGTILSSFFMGTIIHYVLPISKKGIEAIQKL